MELKDRVVVISERNIGGLKQLHKNMTHDDLEIYVNNHVESAIKEVMEDEPTNELRIMEDMTMKTTIKSIKETINTALLSDMRILACFPKTLLDGKEITNVRDYINLSIFNYIEGKRGNESSAVEVEYAPIIEYDITCNKTQTGNHKYLVELIVSVPIYLEQKGKASADDLSEIITEIIASKFKDIKDITANEVHNIKNIPLGTTFDLYKTTRMNSRKLIINIETNDYGYSYV